MCHIKMSFWDEKEAKRLFQELPFYNVLIKEPNTVYRIQNKEYRFTAWASILWRT